MEAQEAKEAKEAKAGSSKKALQKIFCHISGTSRVILYVQSGISAEASNRNQ